MSRPCYCPNCGTELTDNGKAAVPIIDPETQDSGYDCYCGACGWSGDIYPDDEQGGGTERGLLKPPLRTS